MHDYGPRWAKYGSYTDGHNYLRKIRVVMIKSGYLAVDYTQLFMTACIEEDKPTGKH